MSVFRISLSLSSVFMACAGLLWGDISLDKKQDILELMQLDGQKKNALEIYEEIFKTFKESNQNVPIAIWDDIKDESNAEKLLDELAVIYDKYLSHEDITNLIAFRKSSIGQRFSKVQGQMSQEIGKCCSLWGQKLAIGIQKELWDKNIEFDVYDNLDDYDSCSERPKL